MELEYYPESLFGLCSITVTRVRASIIKESTSQHENKYYFYYHQFFDYSKAAFQLKKKKKLVWNSILKQEIINKRD